MTIISDGRLIRDNLQKAGKEDSWLQKELKKRKSTVSDTWLMTVDGGDRILWYPKETKGK